MNKISIILLSVVMFLIGGLLGWQGRGSQDNKELEAEVVRQLDYYLTTGISAGLITINDEMLFPIVEETNEPPVPATGSTEDTAVTATTSSP